MGATGGGEVSGGIDGGFELVSAVAVALRAEFGVGIDAHPGGEGTEAGAVNRAFRAAARVILARIVGSGDGLDTLVSGALRRAALDRLTEAGVEGEVAERLLGSEPGFGQAWLAYLALIPTAVIDDLVGAC